ncbi:tryptophan--tRNA ligase [Candidatus Poribacteria bacterium]|nr:tryptophan--tRNA ligase [Candidatus Poribacteria bacterium]
MKKRLVTGIRPTGFLHLGHLEGMLKNTVSLQEQYECYPFVADWHAITDRSDTSRIKDFTRGIAVDWLSAGLDPGKSTFFVQSRIPEHGELEVLLSMLTTVARLERCPTYKDHIQQLAEKDNPSMGKLAYPLLQTADIIIYKAVAVPVGEDQVSHLEISREIVRRFNTLYGEVFPEPEAVLAKTAKLPGLDGRKMSKSYDNCIYLSDTAEDIRKKVMTMFTDPARVKRSDPGHPEECPVFAYHEIYNQDETEQIAEDCKKAVIGCVDCKKMMAERLITSMSDFHASRAKWEKEDVDAILSEGSKKARKVAQETMQEVRKAMNLDY